MFPLRDHNPSNGRAWVTWALIAANVAIFLATWSLPQHELQLVFLRWGMVPLRLSFGEGYATLLTSMFLHGGFMHLAGNMLFLWVFGDNLEERLGHAGFAGFYVAGGMAAAAAQYAAAPMSQVPMVGASGAIAAVLGGYLLFFPRARVDLLIILVIFVRIVPVPAGLMLAAWFALQVLGGLGAPADGGGVAFWAHAGGFVAGLALALRPWLRAGGPGFWRRTDGHPPHAAAGHGLSPSRVPRVRRRR